MTAFLQEQMRFFELTGHLIARICSTPGFAATWGDARAEPIEKDHLAGGAHYMGLGIDVNLFKQDSATGEWVYCTQTEDHRPFGEFWKTLDPRCRWGGDFSRPDGNHYSMAYGGRA